MQDFLMDAPRVQSVQSTLYTQQIKTFLQTELRMCRSESF